jgi:hypothetical protein
MLSINNISIMGYSNSIETLAYQEGLGVTNSTGTSCGVAIMTDSHMPAQLT